MKNELKVKQSGITLIALIITIIVLLILAGVSISTLTGENGLLNKAGNAKEQMAMAEEKERLELIKATVAIDNNGEVALDKYIEELIKEGITTKEEVTDNEDGSKQIITDKGYSVNVKVDEDGNPTVTVEGKADALPVRIVNVQLTTSTSSIKVDVQVLRGDGATYKYYYKTESTEYKLAHEGKDLSYTIDNLEQNVTYTIKVEAINKNGIVYKEAVGITGEIQSAVGILEFGSLEWNNGQAEVTIIKNIEDSLKIQYQVLDEDLNVVKTYQEIASGEKITGLNLGETVQARLWDGTNGGSSASLIVTDTTVPNSATITLSSTTTDTESSITATVTQSDSQSGVDITSCKWVYNTTSGNIGTNASSYTGGTFSSNGQKITLSKSTAGTYYLHVLTVDKAGNKKETVSKAVTLTVAPEYNIGDEVTVGGESFYVLEPIYEETEKVTLLSKYNLNTEGTAQYDAIITGTACVFSSTNYWEYDFTSSPFDLNDLGKQSIGDAIAKAKSYAMKKGATSGRLLTCNEANTLKKSISSDTTGKIAKMLWGTEATDGYLYYWLGSANNAIRVWFVNGEDSGLDYNVFNFGTYGVRPVIEIPKSLIS